MSVIKREDWTSWWRHRPSNYFGPRSMSYPSAQRAAKTIVARIIRYGYIPGTLGYAESWGDNPEPYQRGFSQPEHFQKSLKIAFNCGRIAAILGDASDENPYVEGSKLYSQWYSGHKKERTT